MNADEHILQLPSVVLKSRQLLPQKSAVYYVIDEKFIVWYVGKAKNLCERWAGKSHHRLHQLQNQKKKLFTIYYELVAESQLDTLEQQRIEQYSPLLNKTKVKAKKIRPTETLLRETLHTIAPYCFILGVEPPRNLDPKFIKDSQNWGDDWRVEKTVISISIIHICINLQELNTIFNDSMHSLRFTRNIFKKRINFSDNWTCKGDKGYEISTCIFLLKRLLVNGFAIEIYQAHSEVLEYIKDYNNVKLAGVEIRAVDETSLNNIINKCFVRIFGLYKYDDSKDSPYYKFCNTVLERLSPYKQDLIKVLFNESIDIGKLQISTIVSKKLEKSQANQLVNPELSLRLNNIMTKKEYLKALLSDRGINLNCYQVNKYLEQIPKDEYFTDSNRYKRMTIYVTSFTYRDLREPGYRNSKILGSKGAKSQSKDLVGFPYEEAYLVATVDRVFWLLLEPYLSDFAKVQLNENEGYLDKYYISYRKQLAPAMLTITLNGKWRTDIPFSPPDKTSSYLEVVEIIKSRLQQSGIPKLRCSFKLT